jgi:glucose 1-dehydrogenase
LAEALVSDVRAAGGRTIAVEANVAREADVARLFNEALAAFSRLDLLVANAGCQMDATVAEMTLADWQAVMDVNLTGAWETPEALQRLLQLIPNGRIGGPDDVAQVAT